MIGPSLAELRALVIERYDGPNEAAVIIVDALITAARRPSNQQITVHYDPPPIQSPQVVGIPCRRRHCD